MSRLYRNYGIFVPQGEYVFSEGDEADVLYLIHKGKVKITKHSGGTEKLVQILEEGEFVGEMAIINSLPRSADAVAIVDCQLIKMDRESFYRTIEKNRQFAKSVIEFLSTRLRDTTDQLAFFSERDETNNLYIDILAEMISKGKTDGSGAWVLLKLDDFLGSGRAGGIDRSAVMTTINSLIVNGKIKLKTDKNNRTWLAVKKNNR